MAARSGANAGGRSWRDFRYDRMELADGSNRRRDFRGTGPPVMRALALIEIVADTEGRVPAELVQAVYRASEKGLFILALHGIEPDAIDRSLDPVVSTMPLDIPGVIYIDAGDEGAMRAALRAVERVYATSLAFKAWIAAIGHDEMPAVAGIEIPELLAPAHPAIMAPAH